MNTIGKIKRIISANINHMIEKAEDPEKMVKELIREMDENIINLRLEVARAIAAEKRLARRIEETTIQEKTWRDNSERAVREGNDELARKALQHQFDEEKNLTMLQEQHKRAEATSAVMKEELRLLENKIQEARRKKEILIARKRSAEAQKSLLSTTQKFSHIARETDSLLDRVNLESPVTLRSLEEQILELETESEAQREIMSSDPDLEQMFDKARNDERVEKVLQELKKKMQKPDKE